MQDLTPCTLTLTGILNADAAEKLGLEIDDEFGQPECLFVQDIASAAEALKEGVASFRFEEVDYGHLPEGIKKAITDANLAYAWEWESGHDVSAGLEIYDPFLKQSRHFFTDGDDVMIKHSAAKSPEAMAEIDRWLSFRQSQGLEVITSNHRLLKAKSEGRHDPRFFELFS